MGILVVGRRHQRQALTPQAADWHCGGISKRICCASGSGLSSTNRQQWVQTQKLTANHNEHSLGTLFSGGTASQGAVHAGCVQCVRKELDCAALGQCPVGASQNRGGRTVVTGSGFSEWDQGQAQMRDVGPILSRRSLGILWPQSDLFRHTGWNGWKARPKHGRACKCQAPKAAIEVDGRPSGPGFDQARIPGSASRVSGRRAGNPSRRTGRTPLDGLRFRQPDLRYSAFLLLASRRASGRHKVGGFGSAASDAPGAERWPSGVEIAESLQPTGRLRLCFGKAQGAQATRLVGRAEKEDPARIQEHWHRRSRLAYLPPHCGNDVSGDGRTPTHDPRLLAAQQPPRHEQVFAGDIEDQASRSRQIGRRLFAWGLVTQAQPASMNASSLRITNGEPAFGAYRPLTSPDLFGSVLVSDWKIWRGRRDSNSRPLP